MDASLADRDLRQRDLLPPAKLLACHVLVIGIGAIGRQAALQLAAMGVPELTLVDHDVVDVVNLAPQGYAPTDLGMRKVDATAAACRHLNPELVLHTIGQRFGRSSPRTLSCFDAEARRLVAFCCVDSIATRGLVWEAVKTRAAFFVDARMSAEVVRILASDRPASDEFYTTTLFSEMAAFAGSCTAKSTIYSASIAGGMMLAQFARWLRGGAPDRDLLFNLSASELTVA
jgi:sulfur carrier protein ThiS adenylyltransferase